MAGLPSALLQSLQNIPGFNEQAFTAIHESGEQVTSIRINPAKKSSLQTNDSRLSTPVPWCSNGYYLASRPSFTFDPFFHAGVYYVQEASSMFVEQALKQSADLSQSLRVLDLCAAPGGKSTLLQSLISKESLLVSNDVIKSRAAILEENIIKWGAANTIVTNNDPVHFARLKNYFDVLVIDAPCSGSGLFRRDPEAINEWSENNVQLCSQRQQRIIADVWSALKQDGIMIYSTCSYSKEEDENILDWLQEGFDVETVQLKVDDEWKIVETVSAKHTMYGYRFYPDKVKGEGFFIAVVRKKDGEALAGIKPGKNSIEKLSKAEESIVKPWLQQEGEGFVLFKQSDEVIALPSALQNDLTLLKSALYIKKAGITVGKIAGKGFIPDHQLSLSGISSKNIASIVLNKDEAIQYLRKEELKIETSQRGWALVNYEGQNLGWIKILPNRINNYYPKEWRIMKQVETKS